MFSSFPLRVECRPSRVMGPGPPQPGSHFPSLLVAPSASASNAHRTSCPFLEGPSVWPSTVEENADVYPTDITTKAWGAELVLEGTARSRSEVRADGTYGVTFDLSRIVKGDAPLLRRRKQFRLQFLDNPVNYSRLSVGNISNSIPATTLVVHSNFPRSISDASGNLQIVSGNALNLSSQTPQQPSGGVGGAARSASTKKAAISNSLGRIGSPFASDSRSGVAVARSSTVKKCSPPRAIIKTGRKYFVFVTKLDSNHFVPVFSPEFVNKKNTKVLNSTFCHGCGKSSPPCPSRLKYLNDILVTSSPVPFVS